MSFSHLTEYDDPYTILGCAHHTPCFIYYACLYSLNYFIKLSNKLCLNLDSSKAKRAKWLLECCRYMHVILVLYKIYNTHTVIRDCTHHMYTSCLIHLYMHFNIYSNFKGSLNVTEPADQVGT